jgi:hypothetical protein
MQFECIHRYRCRYKEHRTSRKVMIFSTSAGNREQYNIMSIPCGISVVDESAPVFSFTPASSPKATNDVGSVTKGVDSVANGGTWLTLGSKIKFGTSRGSVLDSVFVTATTCVAATVFVADSKAEGDAKFSSERANDDDTICG